VERRERRKRWARFVGVTMVKTVWIGLPSTASRSTGRARNESEMALFAPWRMIGVRTCGMAIEEAAPFIESNPQEARRILQGYTNMPPKIANVVPLPTWNFAIRTQDLDKWVGVLKDVGHFKGNVDAQNLVLEDAR
jgi:hypothetical protein